MFLLLRIVLILSGSSLKIPNWETLEKLYLFGSTQRVRAFHDRFSRKFNNFSPINSSASEITKSFQMTSRDGLDTIELDLNKLH